jgi:hypothetical protein
MALPHVLLAQKTDFDSEQHPTAPDYAEESNWSALPFRADVADVLPKGEAWVSDSLKQVDVFYVHPTIYQRGPLWNADLGFRKINKRVDKYPVRLQSSVFNRVARVYAPRYRQAVVSVFYEPTADGDKALDLAYQDVKRAFQYYLDHYNHGRPFIIAGHSQGTHHTRRLLKEMIDGTALQRQMVAAYVIGFGVNNDMYQELRFCEGEEDTGCIISYMSYREGYVPSGDFHAGTQSLNPLSWKHDTTTVTVEDYSGTVVFNPKRIRSRTISVRMVDQRGEILWVKTKAPWFRLMKNLHVADYGLFYMSLRENAKKRTEAFLGKHSSVDK